MRALIFVCLFVMVGCRDGLNRLVNSEVDPTRGHDITGEWRSIHNVGVVEIVENGVLYDRFALEEVLTFKAVDEEMVDGDQPYLRSGFWREGDVYNGPHFQLQLKDDFLVIGFRNMKIGRYDYYGKYERVLD